MMDEVKPQRLHPEDGEALDALMAAGFDLSEVPAGRRERAARVREVLGLLDRVPADRPGDLLVERTLQRIDHARRTERTEARRTALAPNGPGFRWTDIAAVAAMVIVSVSLAIPMVSHNRAVARKVAGQANLAAAGMGFSNYAADNNGALPAVQARPGDPWWKVNTFDEQGNALSNSAHAFLLIRGGYATARDLSCPENAHAPIKITITSDVRDWGADPEISFSYQNQFTTVRPKWGGSQTVAVLADRNPLFTSKSSAAQASGDDQAISPNHARLGGQNVLLNDGSVTWLRIPVIRNGDNIYHVREHPATYRGNEAPADADDSHLVQ